MNLIQKDKVAQLHIFRAIAALGVVITHARFVLWSGGEAYITKFPVQKWSFFEYPLFFSDLITSLGPQRVYLFFILSGFFAQYSIRNSFSLPNYLRKRFLRLYPACIAATILAGIALYISFVYINSNIYAEGVREYNSRLIIGYQELSLNSFLHSLSFTKSGEYFGFSVQYWSLKQEFFFCLLFPLYNLLPFRSQLGLLGICVALVLVTGNIIFFYQSFFLVGMMLYKGFERGLRIPAALPTWLYGTAVVSLYMGIYLLSKLEHNYPASLLTVMLAFLVLEFLLTRTVRVPRAVAWFSEVSYSVYLNHMWGLLLFYAVLSRISGDLVFYSRWPYYTGAIVAIICSLPSYYLIEKPIVAYMHRLSRRETSRASAVPLIVPMAMPRLWPSAVQLPLQRAPRLLMANQLAPAKNLPQRLAGR